MGWRPHVGELLYGFVPREKIQPLCRAITQLFRDYGDRFDRSMARLKVVVERRGIDECRKIVEGFMDAEGVDHGDFEPEFVEVAKGRAEVRETFGAKAEGGARLSPDGRRHALVGLIEGGADILWVETISAPEEYVAAAEAAIGLAILVCFFRNRGTIAVEDVNVMKG